jgi:hypothetical protein
MIFNIVDRRKHPYRWRAVTAIVEPTHHDNTVDGADQVCNDPEAIIYDLRAEISVADAISWAQTLPYAATLYLYDLGRGINVVSGDQTEHAAQSAVRMPDE